MKRTITLLLVAVMLFGCVFAFTACSDGSVLHKINPTAEEKKVIGTAGNYEILYDELRCITVNYKKQMELQYGKGIWDDPASAEKHLEELKKYVLDALVVNSAALTTAAKYGITPESEGIEDYVTLQMNKLASELAELLMFESEDENSNASQAQLNEAYVKYLKENAVSDRYNRYVMSVDGCVEALRMKLITDETLPSDDESARNYINENFVHVFHVRIPITNDVDSNAAKEEAELVVWMLKTNFMIEENRALLREKLGIVNLQEEAESSTVKFYDRLVSAISTEDKMKVLIGSSYNKDTSISKYGYYFSYGEFSESYEKAAYALAEGEISDAIADSTGYYVIQRLPLDTEYIEKNLDTLKAQYQSAYINNLIKSEQDKLTFSFNDYGKTLDLTKIK